MVRTRLAGQARRRSGAAAPPAKRGSAAGAAAPPRCLSGTCHDLCLLAKGLGCVPDLWLSRRDVAGAAPQVKRSAERQGSSPGSRATPKRSVGRCGSRTPVAASRAHKQQRLRQRCKRCRDWCQRKSRWRGRAAGRAGRFAGGTAAPLRRRACPASLAARPSPRAPLLRRLRAQRACPAAPNTAARQLRTDASYQPFVDAEAV